MRILRQKYYSTASVNIGGKKAVLGLVEQKPLVATGAVAGMVKAKTGRKNLQEVLGKK